MNITIFGGTGPAGLLVIEKALADGHRVVAYVRPSTSISIESSKLVIIRGELTDAGRIEEAVIGADAVVSLIGPKKKSKQLDISIGYMNIIAAMKKTGTKRLITAVSSSYSDPNDSFQFMVSFGVVMLKVLAPGILKDIVTFGDLIRSSGLDWTMARVPMLKKKPAQGNIHIGYAGDGKFSFFELSRADLANFLLAQLDTNDYLYKAPAISK
jgi:putative NADH-flavin reductase